MWTTLPKVMSFEQKGEIWELRLRLTPALSKFAAFKGSLTVHGVNLTVNDAQDSTLDAAVAFNLIPHTVQSTTLAELRPGHRVNIEIDPLARYVERMLSAAPVPVHPTSA